MHCPQCRNQMEFCDERDKAGERLQPDWWECPECAYKETVFDASQRQNATAVPADSRATRMQQAARIAIALLPKYFTQRELLEKIHLVNDRVEIIARGRPLMRELMAREWLKEATGGVYARGVKTQWGAGSIWKARAA